MAETATVQKYSADLRDALKQDTEDTANHRGLRADRFAGACESILFSRGH